jgi:electron transfer flavoprotein alpha subunit
MSILILAEHNNEEVKSSTLNTIGAASKISSDIEVLVVGSNTEGICKEISNYQNIKKVLSLNNTDYEHAIAEKIEPVIMSIADNYSHIFAPATTFGKNVMPRVAVKLDVAQISDVISVESEDTFIRPIYAGNALATVKSNDLKKVITIRPTSFDVVAKEGGSGIVEDLQFDLNKSHSEFVDREESKSDRPELSTARIVVSGGRGLQSADNFKLINDIADKLNAAIGASRAAVDAGYVSNDYQVGQTGKVVVPDLYIAVGISGAIQHLAGMKESKIIVAINKDEEAPIFNIADYGLSADLFEALPQLSSELDKLNSIEK